MCRTVYPYQVVFDLLYKNKTKHSAGSIHVEKLIKEANKFEEILNTGCKAPISMDINYQELLSALQKNRSCFYLKDDEQECGLLDKCSEKDYYKKINSRLDPDIQRAILKYIAS